MSRSVIGVRFTTGHMLWAAVLASACVMLFLDKRHWWIGVAIAVFVVLVLTVTIRGRRITGWIAAAYSFRRRRAKPPEPPTETAVGHTVVPAVPVAIRWDAGYLTALIEVLPRPFTPTVVVNGQAVSDDTIDTELVSSLLAAQGGDLEADIVSAGYRTGRSAPAALIGLYEQVVGPYPAPANRRTWIVVRANPDRNHAMALRRGGGVPGLARFLTTSATRMADQLASMGIDAQCGRSFDEYDSATAISFERETWSVIKGQSSFTAAYTAPGGPDMWWSARTDHTTTRVRVRPGAPPVSTVLLTTLSPPTTPRGFSRIFGGQRAALQGTSPLQDQHQELPIGSAGVLIGETGNRHPVYMPFDHADISLTLGDRKVFTQFLVRAAAAGGIVTVDPRFRDFGAAIGARIGRASTVKWGSATTYIGHMRELPRVSLYSTYIETPRHGRLPIRLVDPREESRYQLLIPG